MENGCIPGDTYLFRWFHFTLPPSLLCFPLVSLFFSSRASQRAASGISTSSISLRPRMPQRNRPLSYLPRKHFWDSFWLDQFGSHGPHQTNHSGQFWAINPALEVRSEIHFVRPQWTWRSFAAQRELWVLLADDGGLVYLVDTQQSPFYLFCSYKLTTEPHRVIGRNKIDECKIYYSVESPQ